MDEKIKVRDLAAETGRSTTDVMRVLREEGIDFKTASSSISREDAEKVKAHFQPEAEKTVSRKEVQPGVIVRRRRRDTEETPSTSAPEGERSAPETMPSEKGKTSVEESVDSAPAGDIPAPADPSAENETGEGGQGARAAKSKKARPAESVSARIVRPARVVEDVRTKASAVSAPVPEENPAAGKEQVPSAEARSDGRPQAVPETGKSGAGEEVSVSDAPRQDSSETGREKSAEAPAEKSDVRADKHRPAPAASAVPEGSSQPSLLPPVTERRQLREDDGNEEEGSPRRPQQTTPQVRVISRPDPAQQARVVSRPAPGDGRTPRDDRRPGGSRPGGARPGAPRPGGPRPGGPRPGGSRPGASGAPGGFPPPMPQPGAEGEQSRRKRGKSRRTVDFPQDGGEDFARRKNIGLPGMDDDEGAFRSRSRSRKPKKQQAAPGATQPMKAAKRKIRIEEAIRVADMAHQMGIKSGEIIKVLFGLGVMATINNALDIDTATVVASEFGYEVEKVGFAEENYLAPAEPDTPEQLRPRPPVVTIMGHVDHGKTSLLDAIRKTSVTSGEAGGITQHIGAYHVRTKRGDIVFLDTPGHEAFTAMRARGAQVTDLVVLVVAADDGVMEQTREAINHSKAAGVPILVAVNKIDKEAANPDRVLRELAELGLQAESWGGDTVVGYVSAKTGQGLDELLELIALQAEILELKANPDKPARGHVVEAKLDKGRGPVATVLIQEGTIHQGDAFVCGVFAGRVRALFNDQGRKIKEAGPSMPVEVQGFEGVPEAGEEFICLADEKTARRIAESRAIKQRERELAKESRVTLETFLARSADTAEAKVLNLVLKADVQGSLEAITEALRKLSTDKVRIEIIHGGAGAISETDIMLAAASSAIIIGFNVRPTAKVKDVADQEGVDIRFYDIIYKLVEEIRSAMTGMLAPVTKEVYLGQAEVRNTFSLPKIGVIAGCFVADGKIIRSAGVRLLRDGVVVYTGRIASLKRFKDDAREVPKGMECGMGLENFHDIKVGDIIEAFETVEEAATL
ncbi:MAG: translation initiation factor IF-2 [Desulfovibrionaceae bacterium]|nr:MAG: translation initiation factor IF-2 [Desulfovibrionaceae bacterium]